MSSYEIFCFHGLDCHPMESFCPHGPDCCPMEKSFFFCYHRLDSYPMDLCRHIFAIDSIVALWLSLVPMDLVIALLRISAPMDLVVVLWKDFCSHGLGCRPIEEFLFPWTWLSSYGEFLDLIKSWESSHRLNLLISLLVAIS